tara:strand:+ start:12116 stop:14062 length:1947 start_codon:yes stop_codon:yes gene_type:complete
MILGILVLLTALSISAVAIYYSVSGLVAIFAAAALPIIIMGSALEIGKLVTAVWLHKYWKQARWWLKTYLTISVVVLMFITSMGIFGFLSKAHIEQTAAAEESIAQLERIESELSRQREVISRAEQRIEEADVSVGTGNNEIQSQIDKEQVRIDTAYTRIEPAIAEQNSIISNARTDDATRTEPYEEQLTNIQAEVLRLETSAKEYEQTISTLSADTSAAEPLLKSISDLEAEIIRVTNQLQSKERDQISAGQAIIGVSSDGAFGDNTRRALVAWVEAQRARITQVQLDVSQIRQDATTQVDAERRRLAAVVDDIRTTQIPALKEREIVMLSKIDAVRSTESPVIITARDEIARIRSSADAQVVASQELIQKLRDSLTVGKDATVQEVILQQQQKIIEANNIIDTLTETKYTLQAEYRKLEAEVGPVKYLAEFIYDEADKDILEQAVRWVILIIIFVFDPLAVLLLIASQATFEMRREAKKHADKESHRQGTTDYERARAQLIVNNPGYPEKTHDNEIFFKPDDKPSARSSIEGPDSSRRTNDKPRGTGRDIKSIVGETETNDGLGRTGTKVDGRDTSVTLSREQQQQRSDLVKFLEENDDIYKNNKQSWKQDNPNDTIKFHKQRYIQGRIDELPWNEKSQDSERPTE